MIWRTKATYILEPLPWNEENSYIKGNQGKGWGKCFPTPASATLRLLGPGLLNAEKDAGDGKPDTQKLIWGLRYGTEASAMGTLALPWSKLQEAYHVLTGRRAQPGR